MTKILSGVLFLLPRGNHFLKNYHGFSKGRFQLPEVVVSLINMQISQALPQNKISSICFKLIIIDTFILCLFPHFHGQGLK